LSDAFDLDFDVDLIFDLAQPRSALRLRSRCGGLRGIPNRVTGQHQFHPPVLLPPFRRFI
jgi:hypothetical protein